MVDGAAALYYELRFPVESAYDESLDKSPNILSPDDEDFLLPPWEDYTAYIIEDVT